MRFWICLIVAVAQCSIAAWADNAVTVISVSGEVTFRAGSSGEWQPVRGGQRLPADVQVRTGQSGALGLVSDAGAIIRIPPGREQKVAAVETQVDSASGRIFSVLRELFSDARRTRVAATRGAQDEASPSAQAQLARDYSEVWEHLTRKPRLERDDLPQAFETTAFFQERPYQNRSVALLARMARDFPDDPGIAKLERQARESFGEPAELEMTVHTATEGSRPVRSGQSVRSREGLQLRYHSETESFLYLYLRSVPAKGLASTARIHPTTGMVARAVPPGTPLVLPGNGDSYTLDDTVGREYFWAWSCAAPIGDPDLERRAAEAVVRLTSSDTAFTDGQVREAAPVGCTEGFGFVLDHR